MLKNEKGFTLVEMLFVLVIISILILLIIPQLSSKTADIQGQGCTALVQVVQAQVDMYYLETYDIPTTIDTLVDADYITASQTTCMNGSKLTLKDGIVSVQTTGN